MESKATYRMETQKALETVVSDIEKQANTRQFRVLYVHDVQKTLAEKGLNREPLKIVELCNGAFAHEALQREVTAATFMPCRIVVHSEGGKTVMTLGRPTIISEMLPEAGLEDMAGEVEGILKDIMAASA